MISFSIEDLFVTLDDNAILRGASVTFARGLHAVVGRSGAGKSVLMQAACGLLPSISGRVAFEDSHGNTCVVDAAESAQFSALRQSVAFVHQDPALLDDLTVIENLDFVLRRRRPADSRAERDDAIATVLKELRLEDTVQRRPKDLAPGAMRQVALARALVLRPAVLIVDEPTTGLDPLAAREVDAALLRLATLDDTLLIVITHDLRSLATLNPTLHFVEDKRVAFNGSLVDGHGRAAPATLRALLGAKALDATELPERESVDLRETMRGSTP